jgi:hypothetical protein
MHGRAWLRPNELVPWLAAGIALVAAGFFSVHGTGQGTRATTSTAAVSIRAAAASQARERPPSRVTPASVRSPALVVRAARGDCWVVARRGSATGRRLYFGLLRHGRTLHFASRPVWLQLGAGANVDVTLDGKRQRIPNGTITRIFRAPVS